MTVEQMHTDFDLALQKISSFAVEGFESEEIDRYLNQAQLQIIKDRFSGLNEPGFEDTKARTSDLSQVVQTGILIPALDASSVFLGSAYEYLVSYPDDFMYYVAAEGEVTRTANPVIGTATYVPAQLVRNDKIDHFRVAPPHNIPWIRKPGVMFREGFMHWFCDHETTLIQARLVYVRIPDTILRDTVDPSSSIQAELPEHLHTDIVNLAVAIAMRDLTNDPSKREQLEAEGS